MRTQDPFPVQGRLRVRYTPQIVDPIEIQLAQIEAKREAAREAVARGVVHSDPVDRAALRGIPVERNGGAIRGSRPEWAIEYLMQSTPSAR